MTIYYILFNDLSIFTPCTESVILPNITPYSSEDITALCSKDTRFNLFLTLLRDGPLQSPIICVIYWNIILPGEQFYLFIHTDYFDMSIVQ